LRRAAMTFTRAEAVNIAADAMAMALGDAP
jgi:hypothetical protein